MATYYDALKDFFKRNEARPLASSAQLVYLHLLQLNNCHGRSGLVTVSDGKLAELTQLSRPTVTTAKRTLKSAGLIDFDGGKCGARHGTRYTLRIFLAGDLAGDLASGENPNIRVREDLDVKTLDVSAVSATRACAPVNYEIDRLIDRWEQSAALGKLDMLIVSKLNALLESYTCEEILAAMDKAILGNDNKHGVSYNYVESILKGGERNVRVARRPATSRATGTDRRNVVELAQFARTDGKGAYDDDAPDCSWIYASGSDVAESDG